MGSEQSHERKHVIKVTVQTEDGGKIECQREMTVTGMDDKAVNRLIEKEEELMIQQLEISVSNRHQVAALSSNQRNYLTY